MNSFKLFYLLLLKVPRCLLRASISPAPTEAVNAAAAIQITFRPPEPQLVLLRPHLTLNCSFDIEGEAQRVKVNWLKNEGKSSGCHGGKLSTCLSQETENLETKGRVMQRTRSTWSSLTLRDITANDSGWYFCEVVVDIPILRKKCSTGTEVVPSSLRRSPATANHIFFPKSATSPSPASRPHHVNVHWWVWVTVGVGSLMLAVILIGGVGTLCRRRISQSTRENPIYQNTHPVHTKAGGRPMPSPRPRKL